MDYDSHTLLELKTMCKDRGLKVSGSKAEVVIRLMEDDESKEPQTISIPQQNIQLNQQQMYGGLPQQIFITNNTTNVVQITGFGIVCYGFFRVVMAMLFSEWQAEESFFALVIGLSFIFGGILSIQGYKIGLQVTLITLLISGALSLAYHDEFGPLSVGMGGVWPLELSLTCSAFCMLIVAMPLLTADPSNFRAGSPNYLRTVFDMVDTVSPIPLMWGAEKKEVDAKIVINCAHCDSPLKVPSGYKGSVKCPSCGESFQVK
tara:strand:- start:7247 stop:8029 length:783 start_codon:yes stop_codon:yes gene_type:complete